MIVHDPFEEFRVRKEAERLEKKFKTSGEIRCPGAPRGAATGDQPGAGADGASAGSSSSAVKRPSGVRKAVFDESRAWIY